MQTLACARIAVQQAHLVMGSLNLTPAGSYWDWSMPCFRASQLTLCWRPDLARAAVHLVVEQVLEVLLQQEHSSDLQDAVSCRLAAIPSRTLLCPA